MTCCSTLFGAAGAFVPLAAAGLLLLAAVPASAAGSAPAGRMGARAIRRAAGPLAVQPQLTVLDNPSAWRIAAGEDSTGVNQREYYFTLESVQRGAKLDPPRVHVKWPGVPVARVIGAQGKVETGADGVTFRLAGGEAPTKVLTMLQPGRNVYMAIFHNLEGRRAGSYRTGPWPALQIRAQLNYLYAAREAARDMGLADAKDPGFTGDVRLYGFETNFPNGHVDHPPHFHIMLGWPEWSGTQATHFRFDETGKIAENDFMVVDENGARNRVYVPGEACQCVDKQGRVGFTLTVDPDGHGVVWQWAKNPVQYRLRGEKPAEAVEVLRRADAGKVWEPVCRVSVDDDAVRGELRTTVTPAGKQPSVQVMRYDPDTGEERGARR